MQTVDKAKQEAWEDEVIRELFLFSNFFCDFVRVWLEIFVDGAEVPASDVDIGGCEVSF